MEEDTSMITLMSDEASVKEHLRNLEGLLFPRLGEGWVLKHMGTTCVQAVKGAITLSLLSIKGFPWGVVTITLLGKPQALSTRGGTYEEVVDNLICLVEELFPGMVLG